MQKYMQKKDKSTCDLIIRGHQEQAVFINKLDYVQETILQQHIV